jgi:Amt family ammonium transporter
MTPSRTFLGLLTVVSLSLVSSHAMAEEMQVLSDGNTAWVLTSTALVLFVLMHCFTICCLASVLWLFFVYSLAFGDGGAANSVIGGLGKAFLAGVGADTLSGDIPESVFFMFQMTFAIITPALMVGAYVERVRFSAVVLFTALWLVFVYAPVCHWVWGGGWLAEVGVLDFAGGLVVHVTAGVAALVVATLIRSRSGFPGHLHRPHSPGMTMTGAAMLWVGWFGFNAGSALAASGNAGMAMTVTHISAATASLTWMGVEWLKDGRPTLVGMVTGTIAGLATITPASGFVGPVGGFVIGLTAGLACYYAVTLVKGMLKIDDSLDVLAVHGIGGATGVLLTSVFAAASFGGLGLAEDMTILRQLGAQAVGVVATAGWTAVATYVIVKVVGALVGLTVSEDEEIEGLDILTHGERGYEL